MILLGKPGGPERIFLSKMIYDYSNQDFVTKQTSVMTKNEMEFTYIQNENKQCAFPPSSGHPGHHPPSSKYNKTKNPHISVRVSFTVMIQAFLNHRGIFLWIPEWIFLIVPFPFL